MTDNRMTDDIVFDDQQAKVAPPKLASERSLSYLRDLAAERQTGLMRQEMPAIWRSLFDGIIAGNDNVPQSDVSKFITELLKQPKHTQDTADALDYHNRKAQKHTRQAINEEGMYRHPKTGTIYKVYRTIHGANQLVAKRLHVYQDETKNAADGYAKVKFVYEGKKPLYDLTVADKLTLEQARSFGAMYGTCCICGRTLTNELSIALGIGPVCGSREFGGEFKFLVEAKVVELADKQAKEFKGAEWVRSKFDIDWGAE